MKKIILLSTIALFYITFTNGQQRVKGDVELTPFVSLQIASLSDTFFYTSSRISGTFGIRADYYFNDRWSLRSGIHYDKFGSIEDETFIFTSDKLFVDYLSIPLNANWHFGSTRRWNLNFGLTPSFLVNVSPQQDEDLINSFLLNISYGIGYKFEINKRISILFDVQAIISVSDVSKEINNNEPEKSFSGSYGLGLVYKL